MFDIIGKLFLYPNHKAELLVPGKITNFTPVLIKSREADKTL